VFVVTRSTKSVHPTLRNVVHRMIRDFQAAHPDLGGLQWDVSSNSWWYPGRTVRITISEPTVRKS
jgi:hypothetical protein